MRGLDEVLLFLFWVGSCDYVVGLIVGGVVKFFCWF